MLKFLKTWHMLQKLDDDRATRRPKNTRLARRYEEHQALNQGLKDGLSAQRKRQDQDRVSGQVRANILAEIRNRPLPQSKNSMALLYKLAPYSLILVVMICMAVALLLPKAQERPADIAVEPNPAPALVEAPEAILLMNSADRQVIATKERAIVLEQLIQNPLESEMNDIADDSAQAGRTLLASLPIQFGTYE